MPSILARPQAPDSIFSREPSAPPGPHVDSVYDLVALVARHQAQARTHGPDGAGDPRVTTAALWANVHGIAQLWSRGSLPLMLDGETPGADRLVELVGAALDAHLGPVRR